MTDRIKELDKIFAKLGATSQFVASGKLPPVLPGLKVGKTGGIGLPVSAADAQRLIKLASQAPYGRGEETIVDTKVRRVWQLEPRQFSLDNPQWDVLLAGILDSVRKELGVSRKIEHELYKLLIYEKGSFFAPHRDSEKTPGMFATLVVCLPSSHEGGSLVIEHDGQTKQIDFGGQDSRFKVQYAAFYADCRHEIRPIKKGYRVCLVYNLAVSRLKKQPAAPQHVETVEQVAEILSGFLSDNPRRDKLAIPLEHQYTEAAFGPGELKGADQTRATILMRSADRLGYQSFLALATLHQVGSADGGEFDEGPRWRRYGSPWHGYDDDQDDEEDEDGGEPNEEEGDGSEYASIEMVDVFDDDLTLDVWLDAEGRKQPFGTMRLDELELLGQDPAQWKASKHSYQEATGNEGATLERWYRRGVVVMWPKDRYFRILASEGQGGALQVLEGMAAGRISQEAKRQCLELAGEIVTHWHGDDPYGDAMGPLPSQMLNLLERLGSQDLLARFIAQVLPGDFEGTEGTAIRSACKRLGWEALEPSMRAFFAAQPSDLGPRLTRLASILEDLCCGSPAMTESRRAVCAPSAVEFERQIEKWGARPLKEWNDLEDSDHACIVTQVMHALAAISELDSLDRFVTHILENEMRYKLREVLVPALQKMHAWIDEHPQAKPAWNRLWQHGSEALRLLVEEKIEPPKDWRREAKLACKCEHCRIVNEFLRDPQQQVCRLPLRKELRQHLHQSIDKARADVTHVTERKGSPQTLVCTKTQRSYDKRLATLQSDRELLKMLASLRHGAGESKPRKWVRKVRSSSVKG